ncbi:serine/threonine-protein phosphatase 6 regulatory subunit 3-like [Dorcoceras hygrometricum]|uniref:Serine/threonine-protein phosphatase 6 regulatory subunit 3-like n=1 Tax=Dorcoceras hygrometricum TaxID=472368 RepID=A0A2Z7AIP7_9LAMI|nr:serine/threonine-protein phosphatase 6 regulatory subunit 3-like [Dorcoceras hygrometricum]
MSTLKAVKSAQSYLQASNTSTEFSQVAATHGLGNQISPSSATRQRLPGIENLYQLLFTKSSDIETVGILQQKPAFALNRNQQQPSDVAFTKEHQNDAASTIKTTPAAHQQLITDSFRNNQQLVMLNNSNDDVRDTSPSLPTANTKRYTQNAAFQLIKTTSSHNRNC